MRTSVILLLALLALAGCPAKGPGSNAQDAVRPGNAVAQPPHQTKAPGSPSPSLQVVTTTFKVEGMDCADCGKAIETKLIGMPGVSTVSADEKAGRAIVQYDEGKITKDDIIAAINSLKFKASLAKP